jgi:nucleoid DNA-binding protein
MNKTELIDAVAEAADLTKAEPAALSMPSLPPSRR